MTQTTLYLLMGYPGAGKTTTAKLIAELTGAIRLSSDDARLELFNEPQFSESEHHQLYEHLNQQCHSLLLAGKSVIYDANLNRYEHRNEKYIIANQLGAQTKLIWVKTPKDIAKQRATSKERSRYIPGHETAEGMFDRIVSIIEPPQSDEHAITIDGTSITKDKVANAIN